MKKMNTLIKCPECNDEFRLEVLDEHLNQAHGLSNLRSQKDSPKEVGDQPSPEPRWTTDDSGVVISMEQKAKWYGDTHSSEERNKRLANVTLNKKRKPQENTYVEIAKMKETRPKSIFPKSKNYKVKCAYCGAIVFERNIKKHLKKVHPDKILSEKKTKSKKNNKSKRKIPKSDRPHLVPEGQEGNVGEAFRQAFNEQRDGSRDFAHFRRQWDGKFGSHPLHDDYSDESNAD